jgi:hypothetical protein
MKRFLPKFFAWAALTVAGMTFMLQEPAQVSAQKKEKRALFVEGKIERVVEKDRVILRTTEDKEVTVYVSPKTTYLIEGKTVEFTTLKPGITVAVEYDVRDNRYEAVRIVDLTLVEGEVVRVLENDQVVLRTPDKKEIIVYVNPQTRYQLTPSGGTLVDVRPGTNVHVYYNVHEKRNIAHRIAHPRKK